MSLSESRQASRSCEQCQQGSRKSGEEAMSTHHPALPDCPEDTESLGKGHRGHLVSRWGPKNALEIGMIQQHLISEISCKITDFSVSNLDAIEKCKAYIGLKSLIGSLIISQNHLDIR